MTGPLHRPYPPDVYRGTAGEASGWIRADDEEPDLTLPLRRQLRVPRHRRPDREPVRALPLDLRARRVRTRAALPPGDHRVVLRAERRGELYDGTGWKTGSPGDFFHVPEGGLHGFQGGNHA